MFVTVNTLFLLFRLCKAATLIRSFFARSAILITVRVKSRIDSNSHLLVRCLARYRFLLPLLLKVGTTKRELSMQITVRRFFF